MGTELTTNTEFKNYLDYGSVFAESGMFPDIKSASQGAVKVMAGKELGLTPMQSLNSFYFVGGRLAMVAQAMASLIKSSQKYDYGIVSHTEEQCTIAFFKKANGTLEEIGQSQFTKKQSAAAGIINKDNWKSYPMNMLFARALANGARWYCPDAIQGFYTVEELKDLEPETQPVKIVLSSKTEEQKIVTDPME